MSEPLCQHLVMTFDGLGKCLWARSVHNGMDHPFQEHEAAVVPAQDGEERLRADARRVIERIDILPDCPPDAAFHVANDAAAVLRRFLEARPREER